MNKSDLSELASPACSNADTTEQSHAIIAAVLPVDEATVGSGPDAIK